MINILCKKCKEYGLYWYLHYLFHKPDNPKWCSNNRIIDYFTRLKCRIKKHPCGNIYYNPAPATEPDYRCKNCGDIL